MKKLRMRTEDLRVESFDPVGGRRVERGTVRARACSASEEGESLCCPTQTDEISCFGTCEGTCQDSCGCSGYNTCGASCIICPSHPATCPPQSLCVNTCVC
jgi:hypothetical protein